MRFMTWTGLTGYDRQSLGIVREGKRLIYINGFTAAVAPEFTGGRNGLAPPCRVRR